MDYPFLGSITPQAVQTYTKSVIPTGDWVSYRHPDYKPESASLKEGRYNAEGATAYYLASGVWVAQKEVPDYPLKDLYKVSPHEIFYFDLYQFSLDNGFANEFVRAEEENGWELCQAASNYLTSNQGLSGILYQSYQAEKDGVLGLNMVILPRHGQVIENTFFIKV